MRGGRRGEREKKKKEKEKKDEERRRRKRKTKRRKKQTLSHFPFFSETLERGGSTRSLLCFAALLHQTGRPSPLALHSPLLVACFLSAENKEER